MSDYKDMGDGLAELFGVAMILGVIGALAILGGAAWGLWWAFHHVHFQVF